MVLDQFAVWWKPQTKWMYKAGETSRLIYCNSESAKSFIVTESTNATLLVKYAVIHPAQHMSWSAEVSKAPSAQDDQSFSNGQDISEPALDDGGLSTKEDSSASSTEDDTFSSSENESSASSSQHDMIPLHKEEGASTIEALTKLVEQQILRHVGEDTMIPLISSLKDNSNASERQELRVAATEAKIKSLEWTKTHLQKWIKREHNSHLATKQLHREAKELATSTASQLEDTTAELENAKKESSRLGQIVLDLQQEARERETTCQATQEEARKLYQRVYFQEGEIHRLRTQFYDTNENPLIKMQTELANPIQEYANSHRPNVSEEDYRTHEAMKAERDDLQEQLARSREECRRLGHATAVARDEAEFYASRSWNMGMALEGKPGTESDILKTLQIREKENSELNDLAQNLETTKNKLEQELAKGNDANGALQGKLEDQALVMASLQSQMESYQASNERMMHMMRSQVTRDNNLDLLSRFYEVVKGDNRRLSDRVLQLNLTLEESGKTIVTMKEEYENLVLDNSGNVDQISKLEERNRELDGDVFRLDMENGILQQQIDQDKVETVELREEVDKLNQGLIELRELPLPDQVRYQLIIDRADIDQLQGMLDEANARIAEHQEKEAIRFRNKGFEVQRDVWDSMENERLKACLETAEIELSDLKANEMF